MRTPHLNQTWLTRRQAAERAGVSLRTVDRLLADGTLTRVRTRGPVRVLVDADELDRAVPAHSAPEKEAAS